MSFCRDCLADAPEKATRCPACRSPRLVMHAEAQTAHHRPYRLRRLLRHDREARRPVADRQAADRRRRQARRGLHLLLHRAHLRRALGHADVRGAAPLPSRDGDPAEHGEIRRGRPRSAQAHVRSDAAGRAALHRRGLPRPDRHRAPARHERRQGAGALRHAGRARSRHHRVGRPVRQQVPRQDRLRSRQAARLCRDLGRRKRRPSSRPGRSASSTASARSARQARQRRLPARSPTCSAPTKSS